MVLFCAQVIAQPPATTTVGVDAFDWDLRLASVVSNSNTDRTSSFSLIVLIVLIV